MHVCSCARAVEGTQALTTDKTRRLSSRMMTVSLQNLLKQKLHEVSAHAALRWEGGGRPPWSVPRTRCSCSCVAQHAASIQNAHLCGIRHAPLSLSQCVWWGGG